MIALAFVVVITVATVAIGAYGVRVARTTSDFFVAARSVPALLNASAISGEYLSAASFLGVAALVMKYGVDMLWYPVGYAAGYLILLVFVAAPLRRFGAYTIPDFAEQRLDSAHVRRLASGLVLLIGWCYLLPQMKGAGVTLSVLVGSPYWVGVVLVGVLVTANVALGGMRGITFVQAFQYWVKLTALAVPAFAMVLWWQGRDLPPMTAPTTPTFEETTTVDVRADVTIEVRAELVVQADGVVNGVKRDGPVVLLNGRHDVAAGTELVFPEDTAVPHVVGLAARSGAEWARPFGSDGDGMGGSHPLFATYSLLVATFLGTCGLPHILVRFGTNPDGRAARRTTAIVLVLLGLFYVFPAVYGALGRIVMPELLVTGRTDAVVLTLPARLIGGTPGELLGGLVAAGAFAAFLSTASGLLVSVSSALAQDVLRPTPRGFRLSAVLAGTVALLLGLLVADVDISVLVGWAFAIAASSFCPLLVLGIWWRGLTDVGAAAGLAVGGLSAAVSVFLAIVGLAPDGWLGVALAQPALWSVPLAFATMVVVSRLTPRRTPVDVARKIAALHLPERLLAARPSNG